MTQKKKFLLALAITALLIALAALQFDAMGIASPAPWLTLLAAFGVPWLVRPSTCKDFLAWKEEYEIGIEAIDRDHKQLLALINHVLAAQLCRTGATFERQALDELVAYTERHFKLEESLMEEYDYPDYEGHKAQHDQMVDQVRRFVQRYDEKGSAALGEVAHYLKLWLLQHINATDRKYAPFFKERGLS